LGQQQQFNTRQRQQDQEFQRQQRERGYEFQTGRDELLGERQDEFARNQQTNRLEFQEAGNEQRYQYSQTARDDEFIRDAMQGDPNRFTPASAKALRDILANRDQIKNDNKKLSPAMKFKPLKSNFRKWQEAFNGAEKRPTLSQQFDAEMLWKPDKVTGVSTPWVKNSKGEWQIPRGWNPPQKPDPAKQRDEAIKNYEAAQDRNKKMRDSIAAHVKSRREAYEVNGDIAKPELIQQWVDEGKGLYPMRPLPPDPHPQWEGPRQQEPVPSSAGGFGGEATGTQFAQPESGPGWFEGGSTGTQFASEQQVPGAEQQP